MKDSWSCEDALLVRDHPIGRLVSVLEAKCWRQAMDRAAYMPLSAAPSRNPRLLPIGLLFLSRLSHSPSYPGAGMSLSLLSEPHVILTLNYFVHISVSFNSSVCSVPLPSVCSILNHLIYFLQIPLPKTALYT